MWVLTHLTFHRSAFCGHQCTSSFQANLPVHAGRMLPTHSASETGSRRLIPPE